MPQLSTFNLPLSTPPGARLYHSTASVWLSVDPLSDKYPSVSPYVYCANNPVRLVDPDGREWDDPEKDGAIANRLIHKTTTVIAQYEKCLHKMQNAVKKAEGAIKQDYINGIKDVQQRIDMLKETIDGIKQMGDKKGVYFHYNIKSDRLSHNVQKISDITNPNKEVININVNESIAVQLHETAHVIDFLLENYGSKFDNNGFLGSSCCHNEREIHAYQVEFSYSSNPERFPNINYVYDINKQTIKSIEDAISH